MKNNAFTPLEKATDFSRWSTDFYADGGLMPPSAKTVRGQSSLTGFTFIEMFIVIILIGILAGIVVPKFVEFRNEARIAAEEASVHSIQSAIKLYSIDSALKNRKPFYPAVLDTAGTGYATPDNPLFGVILQNPISDNQWRKESDTLYKSSAGNSYTYDPIAGTFNLTPTSP
ncbi:MAG: hypothetical protein WC335_03385 [Candidatus Omnitrophota bacterium]|jgi:type II secretory pathway pseudopilin PulG